MVDLRIELPEHFLEEEVRCDYVVTSKMKEVWAVELDLLNKLLEVCKKYDIKIFASGGTMLGAVRHKGFIPWDDDIDIRMLRKDYNKLCEIAEIEFSYPYFFQTEYNDIGSLRGHAQLRNSDTAGILEGEKKLSYNFNQGIFLDIFPLDYLAPTWEAYQRQLNDIKINYFAAKRWASIGSRYRPVSSSFIKKIIKKIIYYMLSERGYCEKKELQYYKKFEEACARYSYGNRVGQLFWIENPQAISLAEYYNEIIDMKFENTFIPVSREYDKLLTNEYGDYMKLVRGESLHGNIILDTNCSYKSLLEINLEE